MKPSVVVDVGNTQIKWGLCSAGGIAAMAALPPNDPAAWQEQISLWALDTPAAWVVSSVQPSQSDALTAWLRQHRARVHVLAEPEDLPLQVALQHPRRVGIDRLLDAVAVNSRRRSGTPAIVIDAGSAVTIDWLDSSGAFRGGAIMPGLRLMARALHDHTAKLPLIPSPHTAPPLPGTSTIAAMKAGVFWAVAGGIRALVEQYSCSVAAPPDVFLTGGDAATLGPILGDRVQIWPEMTLEGIRLAAGALP
jgi:type III pantothenate kinase